MALREGDRVRVAAVADPASGEVFVTDGDRAWRDDSPDAPLAPDPANRLVEVEVHPSSTRSRTLLGRPGFHERYAPRVVSTSLGLPWVAAGAVRRLRGRGGRERQRPLRRRAGGVPRRPAAS